MKKENLSKLPYKGTDDMYPKDVFEKKYIFKIWSKVAKNFGYEEYDAPLIEDAILYKVKSGEELANTQLYNFVDKGGREIALRPEMTPSLARMIAAQRNNLLLPIRWFNIGRFYRYEKPQKGRRREFFQLNIDLLGVSTIDAEIEIIQYVMKVMDEFKAPKNTYELRINNRYLIEYLFDEILKLDTELRPKIARALDNYLKMEINDFNGYLKELGLNDNQIKDILEYINWEIEDLKKIEDRSRGAKELIQLFNKLKELSITNIKFAPYIVRGIQYYTGTVVEMYDIGSSENSRALFGGGRYDDLLEIFGEAKLPAFGLGWGETTTLDYLKTYNLLPSFKSNTKVYVTLMNESLLKDMNSLSTYLRENGINTEMQLTATKLKNQLKYANSKGFPWVIIVGEDELSKDVIQLKDMSNGESFLIKKEDVIQKLS